MRINNFLNCELSWSNNFAVDASAAGEGQLEISINEGEVPNHVQVINFLNNVILVNYLINLIKECPLNNYNFYCVVVHCTVS